MPRPFSLTRSRRVPTAVLLQKGQLIESKRGNKKVQILAGTIANLNSSYYRSLSSRLACSRPRTPWPLRQGSPVTKWERCQPSCRNHGNDATSCGTNYHCTRQHLGRRRTSSRGRFRERHTGGFGDTRHGADGDSHAHQGRGRQCPGHDYWRPRHVYVHPTYSTSHERANPANSNSIGSGTPAQQIHGRGSNQAANAPHRITAQATTSQEGGHPQEKHTHCGLEDGPHFIL
jgi:hypothetical protein